MSKAKNSNVNELLAAIKRQTPDAPPPSTRIEESPSETIPADVQVKKKAEKLSATSAASKPKSRIGKPVQFWMHDEDIQLVRELSAWLAGQGIRPSDSMVIRATLRLAKTGNTLLEAYWQAAKLDGRLKRD